MKNNKRILIFGRPGSGKTSLAVLEMLEALKQGYYVYSNIKIQWYGELFVKAKVHIFLNSCYTLLKNITKKRRLKKYNELIKLERILEEEQNTVSFDKDGIPNKNLTDIYYQLYYIKQKINKIKEINSKTQYGFIKNYYYQRSRYNYTENLEEAVECIIQESKQNGNEKYFLLCFDEGFIELDFSRKVPHYITNFLNQTRKLNVDVVISSQRPVAIYPAYRAICDFMVLVEKKWFDRFQATKYYVDDNANALPDLSKDYEGKDRGEHYINFKGKDVFPFFDTRQGVGIIKLLKEKI